jgi:hypothetical protein
LGFLSIFGFYIGDEELCMAFGIPYNPEPGGCGDELAKCGEEAGVNAKNITVTSLAIFHGICYEFPRKIGTKIGVRKH